MVVVPPATDSAVPLLPSALLIVATDVSAELQVTAVVRLALLLSE
jgi:hypothetical protein